MEKKRERKKRTNKSIHGYYCSPSNTDRTRLTKATRTNKRFPVCTCCLPCVCSASGRCGLALLQQRFVGPVALGRRLSPVETATVWGMGMHSREGGREGGWMQGCRERGGGPDPSITFIEHNNSLYYSMYLNVLHCYNDKQTTTKKSNMIFCLYCSFGLTIQTLDSSTHS